MNNLLKACLSLLLIFSLSPLNGQGKKVTTWQDSLLYTWRLDSVMQLSDYPGSEITDADNPVYLRFYPAGMLLTGKRDNMQLSKFEFVQGQNRYLLLSGVIFFKVEKIEPDRLQIVSQNEFMSLRFYLTKSEEVLPSPEKRLVGGYTVEKRTRPYEYEEMYGEREPEEVVEPSWLELDSSGKMKSFFGVADSGSWKLTDDFILELNGARKLRFRVMEAAKRSLSLQPMGAPEDSVLYFRKEWPPDPAFEAMRVIDSSMVADSIAAVMAQMEQDMMVGDMPDELELPQTWQTIPSGDVQLILMPDNTLVFKEGKKKHRGTWISTTLYSWGEQWIPISFDGREQMAYFQMTSNYDTGTEQKQLIFTLVPPGSKKLQTYTLYPLP